MRSLASFSPLIWGTLLLLPLVDANCVVAVAPTADRKALYDFNDAGTNWRINPVAGANDCIALGSGYCLVDTSQPLSAVFYHELYSTQASCNGATTSDVTQTGSGFYDRPYGLSLDTLSPLDSSGSHTQIEAVKNQEPNYALTSSGPGQYVVCLDSLARGNLGTGTTPGPTDVNHAQPGYVAASIDPNYCVPFPPPPPSLPPSPPPSLSPSAPPPPPPQAMVSGDPHIHFGDGAVADFRGKNATFYALLSAPGVQFAARTVDTSFLLPRPMLVHGSFFDAAAWTVRGASGRVYGIEADASAVRFRVTDARSGELLREHRGPWKQWWEDGIRAYFKQSTVYVRAHGFEVNCTRRPVYNWVAGPSHWRFDIAMRRLDDTPFAKLFNASSPTCYPHGVIGQAWDGDDIAVDGAEDDYTYHKDHPVVTTRAMAEGALEGRGDDYELASAHATAFAYSRFERNAADVCPPRNVSKLTGAKRVAGHSQTASVVEHDLQAPSTR